LKIGVTSLVLQSLLNGAPIERIPRLSDPLATLKSISRDASWQWLCRTANGPKMTAVDIQRIYLELVREYCPELEGEWRDVLEGWQQVLDDLEKDPLRTADRLDWTAKYRLIEQFRDNEKLDESDPWLRSLDLAYHLLDRQKGLFYGLLDQGAFKLPYPYAAFTGHSLCPPSSTRAAVRGRCIEKFGGAVQATQWDYILLHGTRKKIELDLRNLFDPALIKQSLKIISAAHCVEDLAQLKFAKIV
jgi:proteasome accessory factor A